MQMKSAFTALGAFVFALSLAFCGHGADRGWFFPAHVAFRPMVGEDAQFALGVNLDKEQAFKVLDAYADLVFDTVKVYGKIGDKEIAEAKGRIAAFKEDPFGEAPEDMRNFLERSGLRAAQLRWAVLSLEGFEIVDDKPRLGGLSLAVAGKIDLDRFISALREYSDGEGVIFEKTRIGDEAAWHIVPKRARDVKELEEMHVDPYVMSLDGWLVLFATSRETLARQVRLYRTGKGRGDALGDFSAAEGDWLHLHLSDVGGFVRKHAPREELKIVNDVIPDGDQLLLGLGNLDVDEKVLPNGMLNSSLSLRTASEKDADNLRTLAKTGLMVLKAKIAQEPKVPDFAKKLVWDMKIGGADSQFKVQGPIPVGTGCMILPAALFPAIPAISSATLNAKTTTMAIQGRKLVMGILQANIERELSGLGKVWPRTVADGGGASDDVAARAYKSSTDYFNALFDMAHYGSPDWEPTVDGDLLSSLWGCGVPGMSGKRLESQNVAWIVAANVTAEMPDYIPVLISANFNPALLLRKWDGHTDGSVRLPIGPASGAEANPFGEKGIVIVRKSGAAESIKAKYLTYETLYKGQSFDLTDMDPPLMYLTPTGVVGLKELPEAPAQAAKAPTKQKSGKKKKTRWKPSPKKKPSLPPPREVDGVQLTEAQRAQLDELQEALDDESLRRVARIVEKIQGQYREGGDAAVPPYMREQAVVALSWFLPDSLAELIGFMADSNPEVLEDVMKNFTEGIDDAEIGDRELATIFKQIAPLIEDDDAIDAILMGLENDMRNSVAVDTYKELFKTGSNAIKQRLVESMQDFTGEDFTSPEQLDAWLKENPDDEDDEEFYGKPENDDKDNSDGKADKDGKSEDRR